MNIVPRNTAATETWFKSQPDWKNLQAEGYTDVVETKREKVTGMAKTQLHITVSGPGPRQPQDDPHVRRPAGRGQADRGSAKLQHGLPESSEFKVEQRASNATALDVVATRTTWVIENQVIRVNGKDVRGGRAQTDCYQSSTYK